MLSCWKILALVVGPLLPSNHGAALSSSVVLEPPSTAAGVEEVVPASEEEPRTSISPESFLGEFSEWSVWTEADFLGALPPHDPKETPASAFAVLERETTLKTEDEQRNMAELFRTHVFGHLSVETQNVVVVEVTIADWAKYCAGKWFGFDGTENLGMDHKTSARFFQTYKIENADQPPVGDIQANARFVGRANVRVQEKTRHSIRTVVFCMGDNGIYVPRPAKFCQIQLATTPTDR